MDIREIGLVSELKRLAPGLMAGVVGLTLFVTQSGGAVHAAAPDTFSLDTNSELVIRQLPPDVQTAFNDTFQQLSSTERGVVNSILENLSPETPQDVIIGTLAEAGALPPGTALQLVGV